MLRRDINARIYFQHSQEEVAELAKAIEPLEEHIRAVADKEERVRMARIIHCKTFRRRDVYITSDMLKAAANHARANVDQYFPMLRQDILGKAERLENAVKFYQNAFEYFLNEAIPTH